MAEVVFATSIVHGKEDLERETRDKMAGAGREEYVAALKDVGITRQAIWHQQMPDGGTLAIIYNEATDSDALERLISSYASRWFVQQMQEAYGRWISHPPLPVALVHDIRV
jgi:hypothetical protein